MQFANQTILVTGGAVRIGRAITEMLVGEGARVLVHYRSSEVAALKLKNELGGKVELVQGDLASTEGCAGILEQASSFGPLHGLVNSAAVYDRGRLAGADEETLMSQLRPNLFGPLALTRGFAAQCDAGVVINLLDRRIMAHDQGAVAYQLSKVALAELTKLAALELAPGIRVNAVAPGPVLPPPGEEHETDYLAKYAGKTPLGLVCDPEGVARAVRFLMAEPGVTGQIVFVDGGQHLLGNGV